MQRVIIYGFVIAVEIVLQLFLDDLWEASGNLEVNLAFDRVPSSDLLT